MQKFYKVLAAAPIWIVANVIVARMLLGFAGLEYGWAWLLAVVLGGISTAVTTIIICVNVYEAAMAEQKAGKK